MCEEETAGWSCEQALMHPAQTGMFQFTVALPGCSNFTVVYSTDQGTSSGLVSLYLLTHPRTKGLFPSLPRWKLGD